MTVPESYKCAQEKVGSVSDDLRKISLKVHENPELAWKEHTAHDALVDYLKGVEGVKIEEFDKYPTAFKATYSNGNGRTFALCSEYDALPEIGHGCGHNLIAVCGLGAFLAIKESMDKGHVKGNLVLMGTPAEEGDAGKVRLMDIGAFDGIDAVMMLHPGNGDDSGGQVVRTLSMTHLRVTFKGSPAHAGLAPWEGVNALDAAVLAYSAIGVLRQQIQPSCRIQGIITDGGSAPNGEFRVRAEPLTAVIPDKSSMLYLIRAPSAALVMDLKKKLTAAFEGAAMQTGCKAEITGGLLLKEMRNDQSLSDAYSEIMGDMYDIPIRVATAECMGASSDFGNVTHAFPGCHPMFNIKSKNSNHTVEFTDASKSEQAHGEAMKHTTGMACTGIKFMTDDEFAKSVEDSWKNEMEMVKKEHESLKKD